MQLNVETLDGVAVVALPPTSLDASNAGSFKKAMAPIIAGNPRVVLDLTELDFVDSSGVGALLSCLRLTGAAGGDARLCGVRRPVLVLFELVRMNRVFDIRDTRADAVGAFAESAGA